MFRKISTLVVGALLCGALTSPVHAAETSTSTGSSSPVVVDSRPDRASAVQTARAQGSPVEILSEHTSTLRSWANPDGTFTAQVFSGPNWVQQSDGSWSDLDTTLVASGNGTFAPVQTPMHVIVGGAGDTSVASASPASSEPTQVGQQGSATDPATLAQVTGLNEISSATTPSTSVTVGWAGDLPVPTVDGSVATFADASPGVDVRVGVLPQGVETFVDLKSRPSSVPVNGFHVSLPLAAKGLTAVETTAGVELRNAHGEVVLNSPDARIWDATVDPRSGTSTNEITVPTNLVKVASGYALDVVVPADYFDRRGVQYPITVDPTVAPAVSGDAFVEQGYNTTNFGSDTDLRVGTFDAGVHIARSYMSFAFKNSSGNVLYPYFFNANTVVTNAAVKLYEHYSSSCTKREVDSHLVTSSWAESSVTWNTKPTYSSSNDGALTEAHGYSTSCPGAWLGASTGLDVTNSVQYWATTGYSTSNPGTLHYNYGIALDAASETDSLSWKRFYSSEYATSSLRPSMTLTYYHRPVGPTAFAITGLSTNAAGTNFVNTTHPQVAITTSSYDGNVSFQGHFQLETPTNTLIGSTFDSASQAGANTKPVTTPTPLVSGSSYKYLAFAQSTPDPGALVHLSSYSYYSTSGTFTAGYRYSPVFTVDTAAPTQSAVTCSGINFTTINPNIPATSSCSVNVSDPLSGPGTTAFTLDGAQTLTASGSTPTVTFGSQVLTTGKHTLVVTAKDVAGNVAVSTTVFFLGYAALSQPLEGSTFSDEIPIEISGPNDPALAIVPIPATLEFSEDNGATFNPVTTAKLSGSSWSGATSKLGSIVTSGALTWDPMTQLKSPVIRTIIIRGCLIGYSAGMYCQTVHIVRPAHAFGSSIPTVSTGVGSVSLYSGELQTSTTDASVAIAQGSLSVGRSWMSIPDSAESSGFGPGWNADLPVGPDAGFATYTVTDTHSTNGALSLDASDGTSYTFMCNSPCPTATPTYHPVDDAAFAGLTLTQYTQGPQGAQQVFLKVTDQSQVTTTWTGTSPHWASPVVNDPASSVRTSQVSGTIAPVQTIDNYRIPNGTFVLTEMAANDLATPCNLTGSNLSLLFNELVPGCVALTVFRADTTTATSTTPGDYANQISAVVSTRIDPSSGTPVSTLLSRYAYDAQGYLVRQWDPRRELGSGDFVTQYTYDSASPVRRLTSQTPASLLASPLPVYTIAYDAQGRVSQVARSTEGATNISYNSSMWTTTSYPSLNASAVGQWDQHVVPTRETEVFSPGDNPLDPTQGTIYAMDIQGRRTNTATFGGGAWNIDAVDYDNQGRVDWSLTPANRERALATTPQPGDPIELPQGDSVARARLLRSESQFDLNDPTQVNDTFGPLADVTLEDGTVVSARSHTHQVYDQASPNQGTTPTSLTDVYGVTHTGPWHVVLSSVTSAAVLNSAATVTDLAGNTYDDLERIVTTNDYSALGGGSPGWLFGTPITTKIQMTGDPAGPQLAHTSHIDGYGRVIDVLQPNSTGNDPGTTQTIYYTAGVNSQLTACGNQPLFDGQVCVSRPASQPATGPKLPTETTTYNRDLQVATTVEVAGVSTRTTTHIYDKAGRATQTSTMLSGSGATNGTLTSTTTYSPTFDQPVTVTDGTHTATTTYDFVGRPIQQTDGNGVTSTTSYDSLSRVATTSDGISTTTYTYGGLDAQNQQENRGLVTQKTVASALATSTGTITNAIFKAAYDANGTLATQVYPNGVVASTTDDPSGHGIGLHYVASDGVTAIADFTRTFSTAGHVSSDNGPTKQAQYWYDNAGRLGTSWQVVDGSCIVHNYSLDSNSNRLALGASVTDPNNCANAAAPSTTVTRTYDSADRATFAGATGTYTYDTFGRTLLLPKEDTASAMSVATGVAVTSNTDVSLTYRVDDKVSSMTAGGITRSYSFDQFGRQSSWVDSNASTVVHTNHYDDSSDSPTFSVDSTGAWSRNITDLAGNVAVTSSGTTTGTGATVVYTVTASTLQMSDMHGDFVATMGTDTGTKTLSSSCAFDEYGSTFQSAGLSASGQYGWLGTKERSTELTGLMLMGVRVYNPATGRFLQVDAILGGNAGPYLYPTDPILMVDLNGLSGMDLPYVLAVLGSMMTAYTMVETCEFWCPAALIVLAVVTVAYVVQSARGTAIASAASTAITGVSDHKGNSHSSRKSRSRASLKTAKILKSSKMQTLMYGLRRLNDGVNDLATFTSMTHVPSAMKPHSSLRHAHQSVVHHDY